MSEMTEQTTTELTRLQGIINLQNRRLETLTAMEEFGSLLSSTLDVREVRKRAMEAAIRLMRSEVGSLLFIDPVTRELYFEVALGEKGEKLREIRLAPGEGIAGWVAERGVAQIVNEVRSDPRFTGRADETSGFVTRNMICVPVEMKEKRIGVLQAINRKEGEFNEVDLEDFKTLANLVAIAIENAFLYKELTEAFLGTAGALGDAIEAKDSYTAGHTQRVMEYSEILGKLMGLSLREMDGLRLSAVLHDVGKIGVEDRILGKPGRLDPDEREIMERHSLIGARIVEGIRSMKAMVPGIRNHHEKYDGTGYPDRLKGEAIPQMARIIAVCDTFDAMTSTRPYRKALPTDVALAELKRCSGTQFDPQVVVAFMTAFEAGEIQPIVDRYLATRTGMLSAPPAAAPTRPEAVGGATS